MTLVSKRSPIDRAFILAAGFGTRLRPYTDTLPKPMVPIWGKPLIDHALDRLEEVGAGHVRINLHHKGQILEKHLSQRRSIKITFSWEKEILDTGGGVKAARDFFEEHPFYLLNGDSLWTDGPEDPALTRLAQFWDESKMDILLLLHPLSRMTLTHAGGDYDLDGEAGPPKRSPDKSGHYAFSGIRVVHPRIFDDTPNGSFAFLDLMDRAERAGRLFALVHDGEWHHISTPEDLARVEAAGAPSGHPGVT